MIIFLFIVFTFLLIFLVMYFPVLQQYRISKHATQTFQTEVNLLEELYKKNVIIISKRLGEGPSQNSSLYFREVHENQAFAINSILDMINQGDN